MQNETIILTGVLIGILLIPVMFINFILRNEKKKEQQKQQPKNADNHEI